MTDTPATGPRPGQSTWLGALAAFVERQSLVMMALGFSAGLPFLLVFDTLSAWLRAEPDIARTECPCSASCATRKSRTTV